MRGFADIALTNAFTRVVKNTNLTLLFNVAANRGLKPDSPRNVIPRQLVIRPGDVAAIHENEGANFVLTVNGRDVASSTHPEPLLEFVRDNGLKVAQAA